MADEDIVIRFFAITDDAVKNAEKIRDLIDQIKTKALQSSSEQKVALKDLETSWISLAKAQKAAEIKEIKKTPITPLVSKENVQAQVQAVAKQYDEMIARIRVAFKEAQSEEQKYFAGQATLIKESQKQQQEATKQSVEDAKTAAKEKLALIKNDVAFRKELEKQAQAEIKAQTKEAIATANEYARVTKQGYGVMSEGAQKYGVQIQAVKQQIQQISAQTGMSFNQAAQQLVAAGVPVKQINQALAELDAQTKKTGQSFRLFGQEIRGVGDLAKLFFVSILGITGITALRNLAQWFKQAAQSGYELVKSMYQLSIGINALRRSGVEITLQDMYENLDKLGERFGIFSQKELIQGSAALINLVRDFGFAKGQIFKLQEAIATLAVVNGRAMDDVQRTVALAISSGYTEGLQRLGVSINRVVIAQEAARLGYEGNYMALTEVQRAEATYNLILEKTAKYSDDLARYQETAAGKIDNLKAAWTDFTAIIGTTIIPALADIAVKLTELIEKSTTYYELIKKIQKEEKIEPFEMERLAPRERQAILMQQAEYPEWFEKLIPGYKERELKKRMEEVGRFEPLSDMAEVANVEMERVQEIISESLDELVAFEEKYGQKVEDLRLDHKRDMEKIEREGDRRVEELKLDHLAKLAQLEADAIRDINEENIKYTMDVAQTQRQFAMRRAEMEARYRENEKKAEIKFQEDLRRLREGFLFDLEDALHERDARQVLRLIRQYNLQKAQATRQYEIEKDERARAHRLELKELEKQRQERLRILAEEHAARLAAIQRQLEYERALEAQRWEERKAELERRLQEQKEERDILLAQQIADLEAERERLLKEIGEKLWTTLQTLTDTGLKNLYDALKLTLGKGGDAEKVFKFYASAAQQASAKVNAAITDTMAKFAALRAIIASFASLGSSGGGGTGGGKTGGTTGGGGGGRPPRQMGGEVYRGEAYKVHKDETFVPAVNGRILSVKQSQEAMAGGSPYMSRGEGRVRIGVSLSPELIADVVDESLGQVAGVVFELERKRR